MNAPITFTPQYQERVWGGRTLESKLGRQLPDSSTPFGESWEISAVEGNVSIIRGGAYDGLTLTEIWNTHREELFGERFSPLDRFPLLFKILDARDRLSIQVHPPASIAPSLGGEPKNEMWYITHAEPGAKLYIGLKHGGTRESFEQAIAGGTVEDQVHVLEPSTGDFIYIRSGRLHAIGAGLLIYEIQQSSDTTYRVFDWNRVGLDGQPRELHVEESLACIDFDDIEPTLDSPDGTLLTRCADFTTHRREAAPASAITQAAPSECAFLTILEGSASYEDQNFVEGDFLMLPRDCAPLTSGPNGCRYLETTM